MPQEELQILYEDREILVCVKPPGVPVQSDRTGAYAELFGGIRQHGAGSLFGCDSSAGSPGRRGDGVR